MKVHRFVARNFISNANGRSIKRLEKLRKQYKDEASRKPYSRWDREQDDREMEADVDRLCD